MNVNSDKGRKQNYKKIWKYIFTDNKMKITSYEKIKVNLFIKLKFIYKSKFKYIYKDKNESKLI